MAYTNKERLKPVENISKLAVMTNLNQIRMERAETILNTFPQNRSKCKQIRYANAPIYYLKIFVVSGNSNNNA